MWRVHIEKEVISIIVLCQIYSIACPPVLRSHHLNVRNHFEDVRDLVRIYRQSRKEQSSRGRSPSIGPDFGFGNRLNAGYTLAYYQAHIHNLTGPHSPGKRANYITAWNFRLS